MDTAMPWITLAVLCYLWGVGSHYWPGPFRVMSDALSRHQNRRSDHTTSEDDDEYDDDVMTPEEGHDDPPDDRVRVLPRDSRYGHGPRQLDDLLDEAGIERDDEDLEPRVDWVARQLRERRRPTDIDVEGAELYGVSTRTIARDREVLARRLDRGTMRRPQ